MRAMGPTDVRPEGMMADQGEPLAEVVRKAVFAALVEAQDAGLALAASRLKAAVAFGVNVQLVQEIEREGLEKEWPPL
jgi:hypothetical protein